MGFLFLLRLVAFDVALILFLLLLLLFLHGLVMPVWLNEVHALGGLG